MDKTKVFFEKSEGEIVAVMPYELGTMNPATMTCYAHIGQHSACSDKWVTKQVPATAEEYKSLLDELNFLSLYNVEVVNSFDRVGSYNFRKDEIERIK